LEILVRECQVQVQGLYRPQELRIFHKGIEFEQKIYWALYLSRFNFTLKYVLEQKWKIQMD